MGDVLDYRRSRPERKAGRGGARVPFTAASFTSARSEPTTSRSRGRLDSQAGSLRQKRAEEQLRRGLAPHRGPYRGERASVNRRRAVIADGREMRARRVAHVASEPVAGIAGVEVT